MENYGPKTWASKKNRSLRPLSRSVCRFCFPLWIRNKTRVLKDFEFALLLNTGPWGRAGKKAPERGVRHFEAVWKKGKRDAHPWLVSKDWGLMELHDHHDDKTSRNIHWSVQPFCLKWTLCDTTLLFDGPQMSRTSYWPKNKNPEHSRLSQFMGGSRRTFWLAPSSPSVFTMV